MRLWQGVRLLWALPLLALAAATVVALALLAAKRERSLADRPMLTLNNP